MIDPLAESDHEEEKSAGHRPDDFEQYLAIMRHYSDLIFKSRVYIISACILIWSFILIYKSDTAAFSGDRSHSKLALLAAIVVSLMSYMENHYIKQLSKAIFAGATYEVLTKRNGYFVLSKIAWVRFTLFYLVNVSGLAILALPERDDWGFAFNGPWEWPWEWPWGRVFLKSPFSIWVMPLFSLPVGILIWGMREMRDVKRESDNNRKKLEKHWRERVVQHNEVLLALHPVEPVPEKSRWNFLKFRRWRGSAG